jgi:hypothetical protein
MYQIAIKHTNWMYDIPNVQKYTFIYYSKALQNIPKKENLVWKYTIWQPWRVRSTFAAFK